MGNVYDTLVERGFVKDVSDEQGLRNALNSPLTFYIGFDPTAPSFHVGNLLTIMPMVWMQRSGHRPIALVGGGTGLVGDPTGRTAGRQIMTYEQIEENMRGQKAQLQRYLDFSEGRAVMLNNADWLTKLNYIEFLRDIGVHFSVNQMLSMDTYRTKLESEAGLNFLEFNYALLQGYDFLHLYRTHNCTLQMGGSDQWSNSLAGLDLVRKMEGAQVFVLVFPLLTTASGAKMGKTASGAVWLNPEMTPPYEFYQYWINTEDADVDRFLALYTFLPMEEVRALARLEGAEIRRAKEVLAFETTRITHGEEAALEAQAASRALFGGKGRIVSASASLEAFGRVEGVGEVISVPTTRVGMADLQGGLPVAQLFAMTGLASSRGEARRLIQQGGAYVNDRRIDAVDQVITTADLADGSLLLRSGKKKYHRVVVE